MKQNHKEKERITIRLNEEQTLKFNSSMAKYGFHSKTAYIKKCIFDKQITYIAKDKDLDGCCEKLTSAVHEYKKIGVNYNQVVKRLHVTFGQATAEKLIWKLHQDTLSLNNLTQEIIPVAEMLKQKYDCQD